MSVGETRRKFAEALNRVAFSGERFIITSHGQPKVALVSPNDLASLGSTAHSYVSTATARTNLAKLINRAAFGRERIVITTRGRPKAAVIPIEDLELLEEASHKLSSTATEGCSSHRHRSSSEI